MNKILRAQLKALRGTVESGTLTHPEYGELAAGLTAIMKAAVSRIACPDCDVNETGRGVFSDEETLKTVADSLKSLAKAEKPPLSLSVMRDEIPIFRTGYAEMGQTFDSDPELLEYMRHTLEGQLPIPFTDDIVVFEDAADRDIRALEGNIMFLGASHDATGNPLPPPEIAGDFNYQTYAMDGSTGKIRRIDNPPTK